MATNPDPNGGVFYGPYVDPNLATQRPSFDEVTNKPSTDLSAQVADTAYPPKHIPATVGDSIVGRANDAEASAAAQAASIGYYNPVAADGSDPTDFAPGDQGATAPAHAPVGWAVESESINAGKTRQTATPYGAAGSSIATTVTRGRDPYRNGGMIGQGFVENPPTS